MPKFDKTVAVLGTGYVGVTTSAMLANAGFKVFAVDISQDRLRALREGRSFFYEKGINPLIKKAVDGKTLVPTASYKEAVSNSKFVFSCVGTPDSPDGSVNLDYVFSAAKESARYIKPGAIFIQKSTVPVGTGRKVSDFFGGKQVAYCSNPEFLREGTAVLDTLFFDRIVVGGNDKNAVSQVLDLYKKVEAARNSMAKIADLKPKLTRGEYIATNLDSAELIKVTANAFLALKISFANSIAKLADQTEADVVEVMNAVGTDPRIGRSFLNAGRGYGGGCFPKDVSGLIQSARARSVPMEIMQSATKVNQSMPDYIVDKALSALGRPAKGKKFAILGLAFKSGTSDARKSPGVKIANLLAKAGAEVSAFDPQAGDEAKSSLEPKISIFDDWQKACEGCACVFVATDWSEFRSLSPEKFSSVISGNLVVDCMNIYDSAGFEKAGLKLIGVGRN